MPKLARSAPVLGVILLALGTVRPAEAQLLKKLREAAGAVAEDFAKAAAEMRAEANQGVAGTYEMEQFFGTPLPAKGPMPATAVPCPSGGVMVEHAVTRGSIVLRPGGQAEVRGESLLTCRGADGTTRNETLPQNLDAPYWRSGARLVIGSGRNALALAVDTVQGTLSSSELQGVWRRVEKRAASSTPAAPAAPDRQDVASPAADPVSVELGARYGLVQVNGEELPFALPASGRCSRAIVGGKLELDKDSVHLVIEDSEECGESAGSGSSAYSGSFTREGSVLQLRTRPGSDQVTFRGQVEPGRIHIAASGLTLTYEVGAPTDALERFAAQSAAAMEDMPDYGYKCEEDSIFKNPKPFPAADSVGLNARIARERPGYRLATEKEIACRMSGDKGFEENGQTSTGSWGTGKLWWASSIDLDGDGKSDRIVSVTRISEPAEGGLLFLLADGRSAFHATPMMFGFVRKKRVESCSGESVTLPGPGVVVESYGGGFVYWKGGKLHEFYPGC